MNLDLPDDVLAFRKRLTDFALSVKKISYDGIIQDRIIPGPHGDIKLRTYHPSGDVPLPGLFYIHGAGFIAGSIDSHDNVCRVLSQLAHCVVVSVDYRLAPEHKFPVGLEECYHALCWLSKEALHLNIIPNKIAIAGDSAGGNLAAATCLLARDKNTPQLCLQILINPLVDMVKDLQGNESCRDYYLSTEDEWRNPLASPAYAALDNLPPTFVITCEDDSLCKQEEAYVDLLRKAGVSANAYRIASMGHLAEHFAGADNEAFEAVTMVVAALRAHYFCD